MSKKNTITVNIYLDDRTKTYKARVLGVIDENEFHAIKKQSGIASRLSTGEALTIADLYEMDDKLSGLRLLFSIKEKEDKACSKTLFVTDIVDRITFYTPKDGQLGFSFEDTARDWMILHEE